MSLIGTLGKLAVGALVAKGVGGALKGKLGGATGSKGGATRINQDTGGMGGLLGGNSGGQGSGGSLTDLLGGGGQAGGGLGGLLESLGAGGQGSGGQAGGGQAGGGLGDLLNSVINGQNPSAIEPTPAQDQQAEVLLRAMINAAKCDGQLDDEEKRKLTEQLGDVTQEDMQFVKNELAAPLDVDGFIRSIPRGLEQQVYLMSLMAINLDSKAEADYLEKLAGGMGLSNQAADQIHAKLGVPTLYS